MKRGINKKGFEFSFAWLFALIVGAMILFLAIYIAIQFINTGSDAGQTKLAKELTIIFDPLETGLASGKASSISLNSETIIYSRCDSSGSFGSQDFSIYQKSGFSKGTKPGAEISLKNKYVFSNASEQGTLVYFFSKPFSMPFKVSELIFMSTKSYCFISAPEFIKDEVSQLELKNVNLENCSGKDIKVCFNSEGGDCEISVFGACTGLCSGAGEYEFGYTKKQGKEMHYIGSLIYGTIFSDPDIYDCNFKRLMLRIQQISYLYKDEANFLVPRGCGDIISINLVQLADAAKTAAGSPSSSSILNLRDIAGKLDMQNSGQRGCGIY